MSPSCSLAFFMWIHRLLPRPPLHCVVCLRRVQTIGYTSVHTPAPFDIHRPANWQAAARRAEFMQSRLPGGGEMAEATEWGVIRQAEALVAQAVENSRGQLMNLRASQRRVSPLEGVTLACCPHPLLQLATQCCALEPEARDLP